MSRKPGSGHFPRGKTSSQGAEPGAPRGGTSRKPLGESDATFRCFSRARILDACVPFVASVLPIAAAASCNVREAVGDLDPLDVLRLLVSELTLHAQTKGRAMCDVQWPSVQRIGNQRLRMKSVYEIDALVVLPGTLLPSFGRLAREVVRTVKNGVAS